MAYLVKLTAENTRLKQELQTLSQRHNQLASTLESFQKRNAELQERLAAQSTSHASFLPAHPFSACHSRRRERGCAAQAGRCVGGDCTFVSCGCNPLVAGARPRPARLPHRQAPVTLCFALTGRLASPCLLPLPLMPEICWDDRSAPLLFRPSSLLSQQLPRVFVLSSR